MTLEKYVSLIENLPYLDQAFETKQSTWLRECKKSHFFNQFCVRTFSAPILKISRHDVFTAASNDLDQGILFCILWGYPRNMRGNNFSNILSSIEKIKSIVSYDKQVTSQEFQIMINTLKGSSIGLSTLSKLLYFFRMKIDGHQCLILDKRIVEIFKNGLYFELMSIKRINDYNKIELYVEYLRLMSDTANKFNLLPDKLEFFLFHFGNSLKHSENIAFPPLSQKTRMN